MEPTWAIQQPQIQRITDAGGAVVAQVKSTGMGNNTGDNVWFTGDVTVADGVVACAIQTQKIDVKRIWAAGYSAGALQTVYMWYARSGYISGVISYSGGDIGINAAALQDPTHVPIGLASHGAAGQDQFLVDFNQASHTWETANPKAFIVDCDDGGNHLSTGPRTAMAPQAIQMLWDHPFGVAPEPYANGLPAGWPSTCVPPPVPANH
jgi:dienelactone hydrolase